MALVIGVTGSIATGKSSVCRTLVAQGVVHCDADKLAHTLYDPGTPGFARVVAAFGADVIGADGYVDRRVLGAKVFGNADAMRQLTTAMGDIVGAIHAHIDRWHSELPADGVAVMEAVNLIEAGISAWCDTTWLVVCSPDVALQRLMARNSFSKEAAAQRLASQRPWQERAAAADLVLRNDGSSDDIGESTRYALRRLRDLHHLNALPRSRYHVWHAGRPLQKSA